MEKLSFKHTFFACCTGTLVQAIACCFVPLLFVTFNREYGIPLTLITLLATVNFLAQLATDSLAIFFVRKIGYRRCGVIAHFLATVGLLILGLVAPVMESTYFWIFISVILFSIGSGLLEVILSPIVEACPSKNKSAAMSKLHSMYGFGSVAVILVTTVALTLLGAHIWTYIACFWALIPLLNGVFFLIIPINDISAETERMNVGDLLKSRTFWGFALIMACGGASEIAMSQWASAFAESSLGISKAAGDILGPCAFSLMMALARVLYARFADRVDLSKCIILCGIFGCICYLAAALVPISIVALASCGLCGFAVGILWPGTLSLAAKAYPMGGAALFALMALAGDIGCTVGPTVVGFAASLFGGELKAGLLTGTIFPLILIVGLSVLRKSKKQA
ncbi:MAG: MFS transporter [Clostridia bacterium]|nr:MFS transporter [Clostridia bacterium]